jgi:hypothetical protein
LRFGSELRRRHSPTIARFRAEVSSREFYEFGAQRLNFALVKRLAPASLPGLDLRRPNGRLAAPGRSDDFAISPCVFLLHGVRVDLD